MTYNMTALQNSYTVQGIFSFANDATGGVMVGLFMIAIFFVMLMTLKRTSDFDDALLASSMACFVISLFLVGADLINFLFVVGFGLTMAFSAFFHWMYKPDS